MAGGGFELARHRPHPALRGQVSRVVGFAERTDGPMYRRELPHGGVTLILSFGDPMRIGSPAGTSTFTSFCAGLHEVPVDTHHGGELRCIQVDLTPLGAYQLFGTPMSELAGAVVGPDELRARDWRVLGERLADLPDWADRFAALDDVLAGWAEDGARERRVADPEVRWAWRRLVRSHGRAPIASLAEEVGWSHRHFATRFRHQVGLNPKPAARVLRFRHALGLLATGSRSIGEVAAFAGYADQSHLTREFRRLAGDTPARLLAGAQAT